MTTTQDAITPVADIELANLPIVKSDDPYLVTFDTHFDIDNPLDWPRGRKWSVTDVLSATSFNRIMVSTIMAPALSTIARELSMSPIESVMALSIYLLATAFGPLVIGPLSEVYGRSKVLHASNVWFLVWNVVCGFAKTKEVLIAARFLAGFGAGGVYALAGGVLGDVWRKEQRGRSLGMYLLIPLLGAAVGTLCSRDVLRDTVLTMCRSDHWRIHGVPDDVEMDVLVHVHFPGRNDFGVVLRISRDLCADYTRSPRCEVAQGYWRCSLLHRARTRDG
jgi:hypothetical protein